MLYSHVINDALEEKIGKAGLPGALMMHYILDPIFGSELGVDAFDQPAVEDGKVLTRQYLSQRRKS